MSNTTPTVDIDETKREAYEMGYERFESADAVDSDDEAVDALDGFYQLAEHANHVAPTLREMAGYADSAGGTYTVSQTVLVDGEEVESHWLHGEISDAWEYGAGDALRGKDKDPSKADEI